MWPRYLAKAHLQVKARRIGEIFGDAQIDVGESDR
jgi:hypothetical protein